MVSINTKDELTEVNKQYTKDVNQFYKDIQKFFKKNKIETLYESERNKARELDLPIFIGSKTNYCYPNRFKNLAELKEDIEKTKELEVYPFLVELVDVFTPRAEELLAREKHIEKRREVVTSISEIQRSIYAYKNEENLKALSDYCDTLVNWEETFINADKELVVNGNNVGEKARVGIKIGRGSKIHDMEIFVATDEKTNEDFIAVSNYTQWRNSDLVVIDLVDKIPNEVRAYFNKTEESDEAQNVKPKVRKNK